jgi:pilus assembly protein FimV
MKRIRRSPSRSALVLALAVAFAAPLAHGAGLGRISVKSALGQPLRAEVEVTAVSRDEAASLAVRLASQAAFRQANLEFNPALTGVQVALDRRGENVVVRIASPNPVNEPYLDLLLELTTASGRVVREYTILLDPPALRASQEVVAPATRAPAPAMAAPAAAPPAPARRPSPPPAEAAGVASTYAVRRGDTLSSIAERTRPASASLDQMLVALFRANPGAFIGGNMNALRADSVLTVPQEQQVLATDQSSARREVTAQSADFAQYRSRLAQAPAAAGTAAGPAGQGRVTTRVDDRTSPAAAGDQLKIARTAPATKSGDEAIARDRQIRDLLDRVAVLERTNQQLLRALELQSKSGAQVQAAAEGRPATAADSPPSAPIAAAPPAAPAPGAAAPPSAPPAATSAAPPAVASPPSTAAPTPAAAAPSTSPAPGQAAPAPEAAAPKAPAPVPAPAPETGFLSSLTGSNLPLIAGLGALLAALLGYQVYRRRRSAAREEDVFGAEAAQGNSLFGHTGGRSVDTGDVSTFSSSLIPAATQVDSSDVDPVAEADVYIAYGREEQAEDILKEALRLNPDRHSARVKLMEILASRGDRPGFARHAADLMARTGGTGEDWDRAAAIGREFDPSSSLFASSTAATAEMINREAMTELQLSPTTRDGLGLSTTGGMSVAPVEEIAPKAEKPVSAEAPRTVPRPAVAADSSMGAGDTLLPVDSRATVPSRQTLARDTKPREGAPTDLSELEFEAIAPATQVVDIEAMPPAADKPLEFDRAGPGSGGRATWPPLPDLDLNLPPTPAKAEPPSILDFDLAGAIGTGAGSAPITRPAPPPRPAPPMAPRPRTPIPEEPAPRPTLLGGLTAIADGPTRMAPNTDQATVPLIDFDLTGADAPLSTSPGRGGALTGSPMAAQIATKLDLARGYIDLGVKDGARELLEEVMRDGTREQRQAAIDLMKQIER